MPTPKTASARYEQLTAGRSPFLDRARHNALLTIPSLVRLEGDGGHSHLYEPYNGIGSAGVINLANRTSTALMRFPFVQLEPTIKATAENEGEIPQDFQRALALAERLIHRKAEASDWRDTTFQSLQQLIVAGNVMEHLLPDNTIRVIRLEQYVVKRDHAGKLLEFVICDFLDPSSVPENIRPFVAEAMAAEPSSDGTGDREEIRKYTWGKREWFTGDSNNRWRWHVVEMIGDRVIPGTDGFFELDELPYQALRWAATPGEDYGRSKIEEHIGDLRSLEGLEKSHLEGTAMAARHLIMLKPGATGGGLRHRVARANNGDVLVGDFDQMKAFSFENARGMAISENTIDARTRRFAQAFLLTSAGQRDAERVTAREIDRDIDEIEGSVGSVFSVLANQMMGWRTHRLVLQMQQAEELPPFTDEEIETKILTGLEALTREREGRRALEALQITGQDPDATFAIKKTNLFKKAMLGFGLADSVRTEEEAQAERQARAEQEALSRAAPQAVQAAGRLAEAGARTEQE